MRYSIVHLVTAAIHGLLALHGPAASAAADAELLSSCRGVLAATAPDRRIWLEKDLFAYELRAAAGASSAEMHIYRENLVETCSRVDRNNRLLNVRNIVHPALRGEPSA